MKKLTLVRLEMEKKLNTFPEGESKFDAMQINSILDLFKSRTKQAEKMTKKYLPGQEVLTIDFRYYDSLNEYYSYILGNKDSIYQGLKEIVSKVKDLEK